MERQGGGEIDREKVGETESERETERKWERQGGGERKK